MTENRRYVITPGQGIAGLRQERVAMPRPGRGQVLLRMRAFSLNFRDLLMIDGHYPGGAPDAIVPLSDGAGEVVELGEGCSRFAVGDRVCPIFMQSWIGGDMTDADGASALGGAIDGVLAEYVVVDEAGLVAIPAHMDFAQAATLPCAAVTTWNALYGREPITPGSTVMALGTGGVAIWTLQLAKAAGARVVITSSSDAKLERATAMGADHVVNYAATPEWGAAARAFTGGRGIDKIVDSAGPGTMPQSLSALRRGGEIAMVGVIAPGTIDPLAILVGGALVRGVMVGSRRHFEDLGRALEAHRIEPLIDRSFTFDETAEAYEHLRAAQDMGKVVIEMT
ncbi:NAD(P)-dependent alcohol dehydrogenase [Novosphingobium sp. fls2-241-R2A-195]|uniref:zinc-dependent alcohol dehydrogenase family protein n=1 Tax=Novosphingobium sp. fls2-241-R2A-195 TaxID=3040296 RepID=UPI00254BD3D2|nr:NAD(P)-dependent alcohol dehydrogenase [Novosphingobium sp. fls2-241-R2A-195]